jgi:AraC family transcriptional regulator
MLTESPLIESVQTKSARGGVAQYRTPGRVARLTRLAPLEEAGLSAGVGSRELVEISSSTVEVAPSRAVKRRGLEWQGMGAEFVQATTYDRVDFGFRSSLYLLAAYEQGVRHDGESYVEGVPRSTLRNVARKLTFVPAGHQYREWHDPRTLANVTYFYFDPAKLQIDSEDKVGDESFAPRLFFEDAAVWSTISKLRHAIDTPTDVNRLYIEALGIVMLHELLRLNRGTSCPDTPVSGGLAVWQQRIVTAYIEEHLSEQISLATLSRLARLSSFHFCRAFKRSFGVPPHRYHTNRRIEKAKRLLAARSHSVTEVGLDLGFSETSSFIAVFRKITGKTPSRYHRDLA